MILVGHVIDQLRTLAADSVHCAITSPPYWSLRSYGTEPQVWGDGWVGELGAEPTPELFVAHIVEVFREVRRVLRPDGTLWLNLGDSYAGSWGNYSGERRGNGRQREIVTGSQVPNPAYDGLEKWRPPASNSLSGLKPKDLVGIPWRVAFALQADGWYLRSDVIWSKPNPMPESVGDRPTKSHEYLFLLSKRAAYYYDAEAVREPAQYGFSDGGFRGGGNGGYVNGRAFDNSALGKHGTVTPGDGTTGRNRRTVWEIPTQPTPEAHFATFPEKLVEPCILAGTSEHGVCGQCGAPWGRVVERTTVRERVRVDASPKHQSDAASGAGVQRYSPPNSHDGRAMPLVHTTGWRPTCTHDSQPVPATVLDVFLGSGTTARVAERLGRRWIGIDLNPAYVEIARRRTAQLGFGSIGVADTA